MASALARGAGLVRGSFKQAVIRAGREDQARELLGRVREARGLVDPESRRALLDDRATEIVLATTLRLSSNAIDVGANEGTVLRRIVALAPSGRHIAYEPIPELYRQLERDYPQVDVRGRALSDEAGTSDFMHVLNAPARSGLRARTDLPSDYDISKIEVPVERLDDALEASYVPTLIKIDVEGAELNVVRGAASTLERHRPVVLFEHGLGGADLYGARSGELFDALGAFGLRIFDLDGRGPFTRDGFEATFDKPVWNYLATPG